MSRLGLPHAYWEIITLIKISVLSYTSIEKHLKGDSKNYVVGTRWRYRYIVIIRHTEYASYLHR